MSTPDRPKKDWYIAGETGPELLPAPILVTVHVCTAEERAIIDAARAYVGASHAVEAMEQADVDEDIWYTAWGNVQGAEAALVAAVDAAAPEEDTHVG